MGYQQQSTTYYDKTADETCELNAFEASFTETAYWLAYFICPIPIAMFMKNTATNRELFSGYYWQHVVGYCSSPLLC